MAKIYLNEAEYTVRSFSRSTSFVNNTINSYGYCSLERGTENANDIYALALSPITSLIIKTDDDELIYDAGQISAQINNIDEVLEQDHINLSMNIRFTEE